MILENPEYDSTSEEGTSSDAEQPAPEHLVAPSIIFVVDEWHDFLGNSGDISTPTNFKYPERCSVIWNVEHQKKEWRQYLGACNTCVPELVD